MFAYCSAKLTPGSGGPGGSVALGFYEGYTHSELAARFGLPLGTVKTRIRNGMLTMRDELEDFV